jgi:predicted TIM-barrel fold metal-dependent hydrolase
VERMHNLLDGLRPGVKMLLFAFERAHDEQGRPNLDETAFYVPDAYARDVARAHPQYFEWAASIHPYRADAIDALERAKAEGARAVKWLPAAMGIDPASPRCQQFFEAMQRLGLPLISHAGEERAVIGAESQENGNPLRLRRALDAGVRVVVAHCASLGEDSFERFTSMMGESRYQKTLFADISAITQANRAGIALARVLEESAWHPRLLNGSDYPLPGVMPIFSLDYLVSLGLLEATAAPVLSEIRRHNPLLFDFVLKRHLRSKGRGFAPGVFETRGFFQVKSPADVRQ